MTTVNPDTVETNKYFDASFERLLNEFVTASGALRNAQKYRSTNTNADYNSFCNDRVSLLMSLLQYYRKAMTDIEKDLNKKLKFQRTPEQVLDVIKTYLKTRKVEFDKQDIEAVKQNTCGKSVRFNPTNQYQEHPNTKINSNTNSSSLDSNTSSNTNSFYAEIAKRYGGDKTSNKSVKTTVKKNKPIKIGKK